MTLVTLSELNRQIAQAWFAALPPQGWSSSELFWAQTGGRTYCQTELLGPSGQRQHLNFPVQLHPLLAELRGAMCTPDQGCWLSTQGRARPDGTVEFFHNWDRRYYFNGLPTVFDPPAKAPPQPSDAQFVAELAQHPRAAPFWPAWLLPSGVQAPDFRQPATPPPALAWVIQPQTYGWPTLYGQLDECLRGQLRTMPQHSPTLLGYQGEEARRAALGQLLELVLACALNTLRRSEAQVTLKLAQEWAAHTGQTVSNDPLADVTRVLRVLAAQMIATCFKTTAPR